MTATVLFASANQDQGRMQKEIEFCRRLSLNKLIRECKERGMDTHKFRNRSDFVTALARARAEEVIEGDIPGWSIEKTEFKEEEEDGYMGSCPAEIVTDVPNSLTDGGPGRWERESNSRRQSPKRSPRKISTTENRGASYPRERARYRRGEESFRRFRERQLSKKPQNTGNSRLRRDEQKKRMDQRRQYLEGGMNPFTAGARGLDDFSSMDFLDDFFVDGYTGGSPFDGPFGEAGWNPLLGGSWGEEDLPEVGGYYDDSMFDQEDIAKARQRLKNPEVRKLVERAKRNPRFNAAIEACLKNPSLFSEYMEDPEFAALVGELRPFLT
eukprot:CAMPEP_0116847096 /NCGR_PEP_ID=MMETSP0418-20121206/14236_1 /TAXON_ID=1158023 /ORGANISM="Astrosyne radiata, Strain 13vi08-1A" /LENGTH=325 /DNA_ID=CAMNT_0004478487 /DNA_START=864 /DNA_END=1841 /DNA_ORIENTATION=-